MLKETKHKAPNKLYNKRISPMTLFEMLPSDALIECSKTFNPEVFVVKNKPRNPLKLIPYIGCKAGFDKIFDHIIPDTIEGTIYDVFGGSGSFSFYACQRFGSHRVTYNDNNPVVVNLIKQVQSDPTGVWDVYHQHFLKSSVEHYYRVRDLTLEDDVESAGNFLYLAKNAFSGKIRFNASNRFNAPIRKGSSCPKLCRDVLIELSAIIRDMTITNCDYRAFSRLDKAFLYLDPPYFNNTNGHYNGVLCLDEFNHFLRSVESSNRVVLSEQNDPSLFELPNSYTVYPVTLNRSLQYVTRTGSKEIIALNY